MHRFTYKFNLFSLAFQRVSGRYLWLCLPLSLFFWTEILGAANSLPVMNANVSKNSLRLGLALAVLFGGVVFEAASVGSATGGIPLPPKKPKTIQVGLVDNGITAGKISTTGKPGTLTDDAPPALAVSPAYKIIHSALREELRQGRPTFALKMLERDPMAQKLKPSEYDRLAAVIAQSYMIEGKLTEARKLAETAIKRSGKQAPLAGWVGGLTAWRANDFTNAAHHFAVAAESPAASPWLKSAAAFWASRASLRSGQFRRVDHYLEMAASHPRTFYGLVAIRALGQDHDFNWSEPAVSWKHKTRLQNDTQIAEAFRMAEQGQVNSAINLLSKTRWMSDRESREQVMAYALRKKQTALGMHLARITRDAEGRFYDSALYPVSVWEPKSGYQVDKALVYALIRQESRFNPTAKSGTGASGLMQILPTTARYMNNGDDVALMVPETNIAVGQRYIRHLLNDSSVNNDLFKMMVAYNAGPGNLAKWKANLKGVDDPLLFIESIPSAETRAFVERVMMNYWVYRIRMGQDTPSLDAIAAGDQAEYAAAGSQHEDVIVASR